MARPPLPQQDDQPPWGDALNAHIEALGMEIDMLDHGQLTGLADDDHPQYLTQARGDARYALTGHTHAGGGGAAVGAWFAGKKWYALGTSITAENSYTSALQTLSGMVLVNRGVGGASLSTASNGNIWTQLISNVATDAEVITIETINDFRLNVPLGTIADGENPATSYFGALRAACNWILTNRPAARAFLFTAYGDAMNAGYPNGETQNSHGKWYWEYNDAMRQVGRIYGIPVIEVGAESGINYHTCTYFTSDMIHMNTLGGTRYGAYAWARIAPLGWETSRPTAPGAAAPVSVTGVSIDQGAAYSLATTQTVQLTATVTPGNATNKSIAWSTDDAAKATVSGDGLVTGVAAGSATITATTVDGSFTDTIAITVADAAATGVSVAPASWTGAPTDTVQLTATVSPTNAANKNVNWSSSAAGVATVNSSGSVTAVANGSATITCTTVDGGFTDTCDVTVSSTVAASSVGVTPDSGNVAAGATLQLTATVLPANASNKTVAWSSSAPSTATVNSSGLVTGVAAGSANITATTQDGGFTDTSPITVLADSWSLSTQSTFTGFALTGLYTKAPGEPDWSGVTGNYGGVVLNSYGSGHNACEYEITNVPSNGQWVMVGCNTGTNKWGALGDLQAGAPWYGGVLDGATGGITLASGASFVQTPSGYPKTAGTKYRMARVGTVVRAWYWSTGSSTWIQFWEADVSTWPKIVDEPSCIQSLGLGVIVGGTYTKVVNVKTGTWTPP